MAPRLESKRISSREVARLAGVSQSTVSRVFSSGANVSEAKASRVRAAAAKLGYHPSFIARSLIQRSTRIIGIVVQHFHNEFYMTALDMISQRLQSRGFTTMVFNAGGEQSIETSLAMALQYQVDGLIITSATLTSRLVEDCVRVGTRLVLFNRVSEGMRVNTVSCDNRSAGQAVAEFLLATGHRRVAYVAGAERTSTNRDREAAFMETLNRHGVPLLRRVPGDFSYESGASAARTLLAATTDERPDAVFCASDYMACGFLSTARQQFGVRIPQDISVVGFDDIPMASWPTFQLTTVHQPVSDMVDRAIEVLLQTIEATDGAVIEETLETHIVVRRTVANRSGRPDAEIRAHSPALVFEDSTP